MLALRALARSYDEALVARPLLTKSVSSGILVSASDACTQALGPSTYDPSRTAVIGVGYGALWFAPVMHGVTTMWARVLPSTALPTVAFKTGVDMAVAFPINISACIGIQALSRDASADVVGAVRTNLWPALQAGWSVWPFITASIYSGVVPLRYRVLAMNTCSFAWNVWLVSAFREVPR